MELHFLFADARLKGLRIRFGGVIGRLGLIQIGAADYACRKKLFPALEFNSSQLQVRLFRFQSCFLIADRSLLLEGINLQDRSACFNLIARPDKNLDDLPFYLRLQGRGCTRLERGQIVRGFRN